MAYLHNRKERDTKDLTIQSVYWAKMEISGKADRFLADALSRGINNKARKVSFHEQEGKFR